MWVLQWKLRIQILLYVWIFLPFLAIVFGVSVHLLHRRLHIEQSELRVHHQGLLLIAPNHLQVLGFPALADDSGLLVEALDGAPGVH
ncbi:MAG: hypothetical protein KKC23_08140, partial [Proteobacteria bacterium]|nr:hypothetical protein [Pseudomonadota bacterium]